MKKTVLTAILMAAMPLQATAQVSEIRAGISEFDERTLKINIGGGGGPRGGNGLENSLAINAEIIFDEPEFLKWALTPQPYINATVNLEGKPSYGGAGLLWRQSFGDKFYGDFSFGLVVHDGETRSADFFERLRKIQLGSRILLREQLTLGYRVSDDWAGEVFLEHLSNGQILSSVNEGVDIVGMRASKRF